MAILDKLVGLGGAVKDTFDRTFGDPSKHADDDANDSDSDDVEAAAAARALDVPGAWAVLGLAPSSTLDDVRAAASAIARAHHPAAARKDDAGTAALARTAAAAELLEEHLLPLVPNNVAGKPRTTTPTSKRARATARTPR